MIIHYPNKVQENDVIGITAISSAANILKVEKAENNLKKLGFRIRETENVRKENKLVSSSGKIRTEEFMMLWQDKEVSHIIAARGGEFVMEMLPYLHEYKEVLLTSLPKWMQGYSDTSVLNFYLTTNYNIATIHSQNLGDYAMRKLHSSLKDALNMVKLNVGEEYTQNSFDKYAKRDDGNDIEAEYELIYENEYKTVENINKCKVSGRIIGGCIDVIKTVIGTPYDNVEKFCNQFEEGMLWCIENCELSVPDLYRALWQMREVGWFKNVNAFLIGRTYSKEEVGGYTYLDAIQDALSPLNVPIIYDIDMGHVPPQITFVNGAYGEFEYSNGKGKLIQKYI